MSLIRIGRISTIDHVNGTVQVIYPDRNSEISAPMPYLSHEYKMPEIDELVTTIHLSNGKTSGFVLGGYWNTKNKPAEASPGLYRKELSKTQGMGVIRYTDGDGMKLTAPKITLESSNEGTLTVAELVSLMQRVSTLESKVSSLESRL